MEVESDGEEDMEGKEHRPAGRGNYAALLAEAQGGAVIAKAMELKEYVLQKFNDFELSSSRRH